MGHKLDIRNVREQPADRDARWRYGIEFSILSDVAAETLRVYLNKRLGKNKW